MKSTRRTFLRTALLMAGMIIILGSCAAQWEIDNPYGNVNWETHEQYKANFHTHTTRSDGRLNPHTVVDRYHALGYSILAIADHNEVTYPWTAFSQLQPSNRAIRLVENQDEGMPENLVYEDRDPAALNMFAIQANELSRHHHMGSFFNGYNGPGYNERIDYTITEEESILAVGEHNGIVMLYHPGRYERNSEWYVELYTRHDHLFGLEVYNQGDRYPEDRLIWDSILTVTMPHRPVWGYSNDDMHGPAQIGRNWNMMILPEMSEQAVRRGMEEGQSYFVYAPQGHEGPAAPYIQAVDVDRRKGTISITARDYERIIWISGGEILHEGNTINLGQLDASLSYVRAELHGQAGSLAGTQPFGFRKP